MCLDIPEYIKCLGVVYIRDIRSYLQVSEGVQQETQREARLVEQSLSLRDAGQGAPERTGERREKMF